MQILVKAKINTYASNKEGAILMDGSKELVLSEGKFLYIGTDILGLIHLLERKSFSMKEDAFGV